MRDIVRICNEIKEGELHDKAWGKAFRELEEESVRLGLTVTAEFSDPSACEEIQESLLAAIKRVDFAKGCTREELYTLYDAAVQEMKEEKTDTKERVIAFHAARLYLVKVYNLGLNEYPR